MVHKNRNVPSNRWLFYITCRILLLFKYSDDYATVFMSKNIFLKNHVTVIDNVVLAHQ